MVATVTPHATALQALVRSTLPANVQVYLDEVPANPTYPYVVIYSDPADHAHDSLGEQLEHATFHPALVVAAVSGAQWRATWDRLSGVLVGDLAVPGRACSLSMLSPGSAAPDTDVPDRLVIWSRSILKLDSWAA